MYKYLKIILSGAIGNLLESYDVAICSFMAYFFAINFYSAGNYNANIFKTAGIFAIGYIARPIGGVVLGIAGDYFGRKKTFIFTLLLMGISTFAVGLLPTTHTLGIYALVLLLILRIIQNFGVSGEYANSTVFLFEHSPPDKIGLISSFSTMGANLGSCIATFMGALIAFLLEKHALPNWGWRLPFFLSIFGIVLGVWLRRNIPETLFFISKCSQRRELKLKNVLKEIRFDMIKQGTNFIFLFGILWLGIASTYLLFIYMPAIASTILKINYSRILTIDALSMIMVVILVPIFGHLSDLYGRKRFLFSAIIAYLILAFPYFLSMTTNTVHLFFMFQLLLALASGCFYGVAPIIIAESISANTRCTTLAICYGLGTSLFGGTAPLIVLWLINHTHLNFSPAFYLIFCCFICLLSMRFENRSEKKQSSRNNIHFLPTSIINNN